MDDYSDFADDVLLTIGKRYNNVNYMTTGKKREEAIRERL